MFEGGAQHVLAFAKHALKAEFMTPAGVINIVGLCMVFVLVAAASTLDLLQSVVRVVKPHYSVGEAPFLLLLGFLIMTMFLCVLIIGVLTKKA